MPLFSLQGENSARLAITAPTGAAITITDAKLYVPALTFSTQDHNESLQALKLVSHELLNGINIDQKWIIKLKTAICII